MLYFNSVVFANNKGEIFLDVFGQDKIDKGFITHRPFVDQIKGSYLFGTQAVNYARLFIDGKPMETASILPMFNQAVSEGNVYNTLGLYENAVLGLSSGTPLGLYTSGNMIDLVESSGLNLFTSGPEEDANMVLMLNIRGK
jgi:hypothetical protein